MSVTIGIDFGTSFCSASWINPATGKPEPVRFQDTGNEKIPSIVAISPKGKITVGQAAFLAMEDAAGCEGEERDEIVNNTFCSIKTRMNKDNKYPRLGHVYTDEELIAEILKKVKEQAERSCSFDGKVESAIITHPVNFSETKKEMLKNAASMAGLNVEKLVEEPVAAAIYALKSGLVPKSCKGLLVYDFGAGTFDVAYLQPKTGDEPEMKVLPQGDEHCGGDDVDDALYMNWDQYVRSTKNRSISQDPEDRDIAFKYRCEREKRQFSLGQNADYIAEFVPGLGRVRREFSDAQFEAVCEPTVMKTIQKTKAVVDEVRAKNLPLDYVLMIGGSSRLPLVQKKLEELLGSDVVVKSTGDMDVAVAIGAMYAANVNVKRPIVDSKTVVTKHFCIYCGKPILSSQKFCMFCGKANYSYKA